MAEILDPALGSFVLTAAQAPTSITYIPSTTANITGDGDIDEFFIASDASLAFEGAGFLDINAVAPQVFEWEMTILQEDANGNARPHYGGFVDVEDINNNSNAGVAISGRQPMRFETLATGTRWSPATNPVVGIKYWWRMTYDPTGDTCTLDIHSDALRTVVFETSGAMDCSGGDSVAGGQPVHELVGSTARGKGAAVWQVLLENVSYPAVGVSATINATAAAATASMSATVVSPVTRHYTASLYNSDGTLLTAPTTVGVLDKATGLHSIVVTTNHPVGHPTHAGLGGWISYTKTALIADQVGAFFYVADSVTTASLESGFSVEMLPQLTNDGNG